jgi:hypothetical protein
VKAPAAGALLVTCALLLPAAVVPALAQGLGDVASREKQKRQSQAKTGKVFTEADLAGTREKTPDTDTAATAGAPATPANPPAPATPATPPAGTEPTPTAGDGSHSLPPTDTSAPPTSSRAADPSAGLDAAEAALAVERDRQERILLEADWRTRFADARRRLAEADARAWRDVVEVELIAGVPYQVRKRVHVETDDLQRARRQLEDLEEEFRRTGLPAGWARE